MQWVWGQNVYASSRRDRKAKQATNWQTDNVKLNRAS